MHKIVYYGDGSAVGFQHKEMEKKALSVLLNHYSTSCREKEFFSCEQNEMNTDKCLRF